VNAAATSPKAIVTDIEGTTSSLAFVHEVLFPYSRTRLAEFVEAHPEQAAPILDQVRAEAGEPTLDRDGCVSRLLEWHDADRKIAPLKTLQGMIWAEGFAHGVLKGHIYLDALEGLRRWRARGIALYVYSSGSVAAQKLIFGNTEHGDLTPLFSGYFDTAVGGKKEAASYAAIARDIGLDPADILFLSDVGEELAAASEAGLQVVLLTRDGLPQASRFTAVSSFDPILPAKGNA
jgi:enolase-phosphatase E1